MELKNGLADLKPTMLRSGVTPVPSATRSAYLHPGHMVVSTEPKLLTTILGSCVAVCLWDLSTRIGGMVHFLLPDSSGGTGDKTRYGDVAVPLLINELKRHGGNVHMAKAKLYGGACVLQAFRNGTGEHLGARNVSVARDVLRAANIGLIEEQVMGNLSRKIVFDTASGSTTVHVVGQDNCN